MSALLNEVWVSGERLDLDAETQLLPTFQANDRTKPDTIQSDYSPEFSVPGTARNHRLLGHAAAESSTSGTAYARLPAVLSSGGVETLPRALLYVKGYAEGRYDLQLVGGNRRLVEALGEKTLRDLDLSRFNHAWVPDNILVRLPYAHWEANGWGYEVLDRGKPVDLQAVDPYTLYPSVSGRLVWQQLLEDAGFTADDLGEDPLFAALNLPTTAPFSFGEDFRAARGLQAGFLHRVPVPRVRRGDSGVYHTGDFGPERLPFAFTGAAPYRAPAAATGATYSSGVYRVGELGYYKLSATVPARFGCVKELFGEVSCQVTLYVNGALYYRDGNLLGHEEKRIEGYETHTFAPSIDRVLLRPLDTVEVRWRGRTHDTSIYHPSDPYWLVGPYGGQVLLPDGQTLASEVRFSVELLEEFPAGGLVRLQEWLPDLKQLDFFKTVVAVLGLTVQCEAHRPYLRLATGGTVLANAGRAKDWTAKRDAFRGPPGLPERKLSFRLGEFGRANYLKWAPDAQVSAGHGDGRLAVADAQVPAEFTMVELPFAASEESNVLPGFLRIATFTRASVVDEAYQPVEPKPRLALRRAQPNVSGQLRSGPNVSRPFTTTASYFADAFEPVDLDADRTLLPRYWPDLAALLLETRALTERYRLTAQDIAELDFAVPIWDGVLNGFFIVSKVSEFDARRATEVELARLHPTKLPALLSLGEGLEFYHGDFANTEYY